MTASVLLLLVVVVGPTFGFLDVGSLIGGGGEATVKKNYFVTLTQGPGPILEQVLSRGNFTSRGAKITAIVDALQAHAALTQGPLITFLTSRLNGLIGIRFRTFWITNSLFLEGVNPRVLNVLRAAFPTQIASIDEETISHISPLDVQEAEEPEVISARQNQRVTWGLQKIGAPELWRRGIRGKGIVVGIIDTGVRGSHESLRGNYLNNGYSWFDPSRSSINTPTDSNGHGTHCAGTICGNNPNNYQIGVAPEAKWIACRGCAGRSCTQAHLEACGEFMACPTTPTKSQKNCDLTPHIVSNSWGGSGNSRSYDRIIDMWRAADIIPIFAIGNSGPDCSSNGSPGDGPKVIGVGSIVQDDRHGKTALSSFSSRGPTRDRRIKPDLAAPGSDVYSAFIRGNSDGIYGTMSGTSMACPHVAGIAALMLSVKNNANYDEVKNAMIRSCVTDNIIKPSNACGSSSSNTYSFPNSEFGAGIINAPRAVDNLSRNSG